jgi:hypothetical protein
VTLKYYIIIVVIIILFVLLLLFCPKYVGDEPGWAIHLYGRDFNTPVWARLQYTWTGKTPINWTGEILLGGGSEP